MLKQTLTNNMILKEVNPESGKASLKPQSSMQDLSSVNLFALQANHNDIFPSMRSKSTQKFRLFKKKTPSEIIKDGLIRSRQSKRMNSLKSITSENIKLFLRLQEQKSSYKFDKLHKQLSCSILPLAKSHITTKLTKQNEHDGSNFRIVVRCSSAASTLKSRCASLRSIIKPDHSTSQQKTDSIAQITSSRAVSKISSQAEKMDKENIVGNRPLASGKMHPRDEEAIILRKIGVKVPIDRQRLLNKNQKLTENIANRHFASNTQTKTITPQESVGVLTQRKIQSNIPI